MRQSFIKGPALIIFVVKTYLKGRGYPGKRRQKNSFQPQRGCDMRGMFATPECDATPLGLGTDFWGMFTQGSSSLATLGWRTQSLWDWFQCPSTSLALFPWCKSGGRNPLGIGSMSLLFVGFVSLV